MNRNLIINGIEPSPLSLRHPLGVSLDLTLTLKNLRGVPVDPSLMQFVLLARSRGEVDPYDVEAFDAVNGIGKVAISGSALTDVNGYTIELYSRRAADAPGDPPVPSGLLARGALITEGSAYGAHGAMSMANTVVVTGPPGPPGPSGAPIVSDTAPAGPVTPGSLWWESDSANLYVWYDDGTSAQWVQIT